MINMFFMIINIIIEYDRVDVFGDGWQTQGGLSISG